MRSRGLLPLGDVGEKDKMHAGSSLFPACQMTRLVDIENLEIWTLGYIRGSCRICAWRVQSFVSIQTGADAGWNDYPLTPGMKHLNFQRWKGIRRVQRRKIN